MNRDRLAATSFIEVYQSVKLSFLRKSKVVKYLIFLELLEHAILETTIMARNIGTRLNNQNPFPHLPSILRVFDQFFAMCAIQHGLARWNEATYSTLGRKSNVNYLSMGRVSALKLIPNQK